VDKFLKINCYGHILQFFVIFFQKEMKEAKVKDEEEKKTIFRE
jgi:hypothetical protein